VAPAPRTTAITPGGSGYTTRSGTKRMSNVNDPCGPTPSGWRKFVPGTADWKRRREVELCRATYIQVQEIVDDEMPACEETQVLIAHLESCSTCGAEAQAVRELNRAVERVDCREADDIARRLSGRLDKLLAEDT